MSAINGILFIFILSHLTHAFCLLFFSLRAPLPSGRTCSCDETRIKKNNLPIRHSSQKMLSLEERKVILEGECMCNVGLRD